MVSSGIREPKLWPVPTRNPYDFSEIRFGVLGSPPPIMDDRTILNMIKCQNEDCKAGDWTIKRGLAGDKGNGKDL